MHDLRDVGGTKGGIGWFLGGLAMIIAGLYLLMQQVTVHGGYWGSGSGWGRVGGGSGTSFGLTLVPLLVGIAILFYDGKSKVGWLLAGGGLLIILAGIIGSLRIHFRSATLFDTLVILVLIAGGLGIFLRSLKAARDERDRERERGRD